MFKRESDVQAVQKAMQLISGKWKIPILISLRIHGPMRFWAIAKQGARDW